MGHLAQKSYHFFRGFRAFFPGNKGVQSKRLGFFDKVLAVPSSPVNNARVKQLGWIGAREATGSFWGQS
jgi:hypothetical protein